MYVIQVNQKDWLIGIWHGWIVSSSTTDKAAVYQNFSFANEVAEYCRRAFPNVPFTVHTLEMGSPRMVSPFFRQPSFS